MSQQFRKQTLYSGPYNKVVQIKPQRRQFIFEGRDSSPTFSALLKAYNKFSCYCSQGLKEAGISTHFIEMSSPNSHVFEQTRIIPLVWGGRFCLQTFSECFTGTSKSDFDVRTFAGKPLFFKEALRKGITQTDFNYLLEDMKETGKVLYTLLGKQNFHLDFFRTTFGYNQKGEILLCDHFSPFNMQIYDLQNACYLVPERPGRFLEFASLL